MMVTNANIQAMRDKSRVGMRPRTDSTRTNMARALTVERRAVRAIKAGGAL